MGRSVLRNRGGVSVVGGDIGKYLLIPGKVCASDTG
jgi:hypothetical protein